MESVVEVTSSLDPNPVVCWPSPCAILPASLLLQRPAFVSLGGQHYDEGFSGRRAVAAALHRTGTTIAVAGVIMLLAFSAMLLSATPVLNQVGWGIGVVGHRCDGA